MHLFKCVFVIAAFLHIQSCRTLPTSAPKELAEATHSLHQNLDESFSQTIVLMEERAYLRYNDTLITRTQYTDPVAVQLDAQFEKRLGYINILEAYFHALAELAERNNDQDVHDAAYKLDAALTGLKEKVPQSEQAFYGHSSLGLSIVTDFIIRAATEGIKRKTIIMAMDTAAPSLDSICAMLVSELRTSQMLVTSNENSVVQRLIAIRNTEESHSARAVWDKDIVAHMKRVSELQSSYQSALALVKSLPKAHAQARALLSKKSKLRDAISYVSFQGKELGELFAKLNGAH